MPMVASLNPLASGLVDRSAATAVVTTAATWAQAPLDTYDAYFYDTGSDPSVGVAGQTIRANLPGLYLLMAQANFASSPTGRRIVAPFLSPTTTDPIAGVVDRTDNGVLSFWTGHVSIVNPIPTTPYFVRTVVYQTSGGNLNLPAGNSTLAVVRLDRYWHPGA